MIFSYNNITEYIKNAKNETLFIILIEGDTKISEIDKLEKLMLKYKKAPVCIIDKKFTNIKNIKIKYKININITPNNMKHVLTEIEKSNQHINEIILIKSENDLYNTIWSKDYLYNNFQ